jgi:formylglycine-generating enzyme required for sulfatase activity
MNSRVASILVSCAIVAPAMAQSCPSDLNFDGDVNGEDLGIVLSAWGPCMAGAPTCSADISQDGAVDGVDLGLLLAAWGSCPVVTPEWATLIEARPDPAVVTDPVLRQRIIATGYAWRVKDTGTQIEMLLAPPGTFQMGCSQAPQGMSCFGWELSVHSVTLTRAFYLGRYEVTQEQWMSRSSANPSFFQGASVEVPAALVASRPVDTVSWNAAQAFVAGAGLRLPTEAEWEYACRAGTLTPFHDGSGNAETLPGIAWFNVNSAQQTRPVGLRSANGFGFHDMLGNVWEHCSDFWSDGYPSTAQVDPTGPATGSNHVTRGSCWANGDIGIRSSYRSSEIPGSTGNGSGFRVARNP